MQECRDESEIYNCQWTQLSNNKFIDGILGVCLTLLDCKNTVHAKLKCRLYCQCMILSYFLFALMLFYVAGAKKHITNFDSP